MLELDETVVTSYSLLTDGIEVDDLLLWGLCQLPLQFDHLFLQLLQLLGQIYRLLTVLPVRVASHCSWKKLLPCLADFLLFLLN